MMRREKENMICNHERVLLQVSQMVVFEGLEFFSSIFRSGVCNFRISHDCGVEKRI